MIRKIKEEDITKVMTIWTKGNFKAHYFIDKDYWLLNFNKVKDEYLKQATTYVYEKEDEVRGFISIIEPNYIGALFVHQDYLRQGIGRKLINYCKERYDELTLKVYEKNVGATLFYINMGFINEKVQINEETNQKEYVMRWKK